MKIYTRTGDDGTTGLIGGGRVRKSDLRLDCYGTTDELNAAIGLVLTIAPQWLKTLLEPVQSELFVLGSFLAAPENDPKATKHLPSMDEQMITRLESEIDAFDKELPKMKYFIMPGGCELAARLHLARTICRRCERLVVAFAMDHPIQPVIAIYLNRLSDWLFVCSRVANHRENIADVPWVPQKDKKTETPDVAENQSRL